MAQVQILSQLPALHTVKHKRYERVQVGLRHYDLRIDDDSHHEWREMETVTALKHPYENERVMRHVSQQEFLSLKIADQTQAALSRLQNDDQFSEEVVNYLYDALDQPLRNVVTKIGVALRDDRTNEVVDTMSAEVVGNRVGVVPVSLLIGRTVRTPTASGVIAVMEERRLTPWQSIISQTYEEPAPVRDYGGLAATIDGNPTETSSSYVQDVAAALVQAAQSAAAAGSSIYDYGKTLLNNNLQFAYSDTASMWWFDSIAALRRWGFGNERAIAPVERSEKQLALEIVARSIAHDFDDEGDVFKDVLSYEPRRRIEQPKPQNRKPRVSPTLGTKTAEGATLPREVQAGLREYPALLKAFATRQEMKRVKNISSRIESLQRQLDERNRQKAAKREELKQRVRELRSLLQDEVQRIGWDAARKALRSGIKREKQRRNINKPLSAEQLKFYALKWRNLRNLREKKEEEQRAQDALNEQQKQRAEELRLETLEAKSAAEAAEDKAAREVFQKQVLDERFNLYDFDTAQAVGAGIQTPEDFLNTDLPMKIIENQDIADELQRQNIANSFSAQIIQYAAQQASSEYLAANSNDTYDQTKHLRAIAESMASAVTTAKLQQAEREVQSYNYNAQSVVQSTAARQNRNEYGNSVVTVLGETSTDVVPEPPAKLFAEDLKQELLARASQVQEKWRAASTLQRNYRAARHNAFIRQQLQKQVGAKRRKLQRELQKIENDRRRNQRLAQLAPVLQRQRRRTVKRRKYKTFLRDKAITRAVAETMQRYDNWVQKMKDKSLYGPPEDLTEQDLPEEQRYHLFYDLFDLRSQSSYESSLRPLTEFQKQNKLANMLMRYGKNYKLKLQREGERLGEQRFADATYRNELYAEFEQNKVSLLDEIVKVSKWIAKVKTLIQDISQENELSTVERDLNVYQKQVNAFKVKLQQDVLIDDKELKSIQRELQNVKNYLKSVVMPLLQSSVDVLPNTQQANIVETSSIVQTAPESSTDVLTNTQQANIVETSSIVQTAPEPSTDVLTNTQQANVVETPIIVKTSRVLGTKTTNPEKLRIKNTLSKRPRRRRSSDNRLGTVSNVDKRATRIYEQADYDLMVEQYL